MKLDSTISEGKNCIHAQFIACCRAFQTTMQPCKIYLSFSLTRYIINKLLWPCVPVWYAWTPVYLFYVLRGVLHALSSHHTDKS